MLHRYTLRQGEDFKNTVLEHATFNWDLLPLISTVPRPI